MSRPTLADACRMVQFGDPVRAIEAFNAGAAAAGGDDTPMPPGSVYETTLPDGRSIRVVFAEDSDG